MKKKAIILLVALFFLAGCKDVKLKDGQNAIVTFKEGGISSQDLYSELKATYGAEKVMNLIDKYLLDKLYKETDEEKQYINDNLKTVKDSAKEMDADLDLYLKYYYGVSSEDAYKEYLRLNYRRDLYKEDYAKEIVSDKQIEEYYDEEVFGDIEASHILITFDISDDATDEEKEQAEKDAEDKAKEVIDKLNDGEDFAELAKEYSKDDATKENGGNLGKVNYGDVDVELLDALRDMDDEKYSSSPVKSPAGYHVLYRKSQDEKPSLEDKKENIIEIIGKTISAETGFQVTALKALREKNEMNFEDTYLGEDYENYMARLEAQYQNQ